MKKLIERWYVPQEARKICYEQQLANGNIKKWTFDLTEKWQAYSDLTSEQRDLIRNKHYAERKNSMLNV